jgi:DNA adenine methylase
MLDFEHPKRAPFTYYGGKSAIVSNILPLIVPHTVYVEPFVGAGSVLFSKPWPQVSNLQHYREVINDSNGDLINFYRVLQDKDKAEKLVHRIEFTPYAMSEHSLSKEVLKSKSDYSDIDCAWVFFCKYPSIVREYFPRGLGLFHIWWG